MELKKEHGNEWFLYCAQRTECKGNFISTVLENVYIQLGSAHTMGTNTSSQNTRSVREIFAKCFTRQKDLCHGKINSPTALRKYTLLNKQSAKGTLNEKEVMPTTYSVRTVHRTKELGI